MEPLLWLWSFDDRWLFNLPFWRCYYLLNILLQVLLIFLAEKMLSGREVWAYARMVVSVLLIILSLWLAVRKEVKGGERWRRTYSLIGICFLILALISSGLSIVLFINDGSPFKIGDEYYTDEKYYKDLQYTIYLVGIVPILLNGLLLFVTKILGVGLVLLWPKLFYTTE